MSQEFQREWESKLDPSLSAEFEDAHEIVPTRLQLLVRLNRDADSGTRDELASVGFECQSVIGDIVTGFADLVSVRALAALPIVRVIEHTRPLSTDTEIGERVGLSETEAGTSDQLFNGG